MLPCCLKGVLVDIYVPDPGLTIWDLCCISLTLSDYFKPSSPSSPSPQKCLLLFEFLKNVSRDLRQHRHKWIWCYIKIHKLYLNIVTVMMTVCTFIQCRHWSVFWYIMTLNWHITFPYIKSHNESLITDNYCILPCNISIQLHYRVSIDFLLTKLASRWWQQNVDWPFLQSGRRRHCVNKWSSKHSSFQIQPKSI